MAPALLRKTYDWTVHYTLRLTRFWMHALFCLWHWGRHRSVPPVDDPLLLRSATALADDIRHGRLKSEDVVRSYMRRIEEVEPLINATVERRFGDALEEARAADALVAAHSADAALLELEKPLLGVPFTVKSLIGVKGMGCASGSLLWGEARATADAEAVRLLRAAGAVCLATTNTAEFGMNFETSNRLHGTTRNPHDTARTCGGSSGGEGALVGAAGSVLGLGNDLAGSIRLPCHYNGLFGHKPTRGAVSNAGVFPVPEARIHEYLSTGPMCRYAEDLALAMRVLNAGAERPIKWGAKVDFSKVKIYFKETMDNIPAIPKLDSEYLSLFRKAVDHFRSAHGNDVSELTSPDLSQTPAIVLHSLISANRDVTATFTGGKGGVRPGRELLKYCVGQSRFTFGPLVVMNAPHLSLLYQESQVQRYEQLKEDIYRELEKVLDEDAVLLLPTFPRAAPYHNETLLLLWSTAYTALFNALGMPATQCALGRGADSGLPLGLQVVGRRGSDALTLAFAVELERVFGGWGLGRAEAGAQPPHHKIDMGAPESPSATSRSVC